MLFIRSPPYFFSGSSQLQIIFPGMQSHGENKQTNQTSYGKVLLRAWQITTECNRGSTNDLACTKPGPLGQKFEASEVPEAMSLIFPPLAPKPPSLYEVLGLFEELVPGAAGFLEAAGDTPTGQPC